MGRSIRGVVTAVLDWRIHTGTLCPGPTLGPGLPPSAPLHRLLRQLGEHSTLQAQWPSGTEHLHLWTSSANGRSTAGICHPTEGTTEEKAPSMASLIIKKGIFL